jgi:lipid-A-disaccharide synthase
VSYQIAKRLITIKYISLVNLIMDREVVKELIQDALTEESLKHQLDLLLNNPSHRQQMLDAYKEMVIRLGKGGAAQKAARMIFDDIKS